ncbi:MAG: cation:dicarboxylase symporter family transporter [Treponema sp.]|nr:dicarboxylate/amino acid:cation symporter [Treponema sp.]MCI6592415.1 dicarboxylate/amino acid:cation symporter [Spirochaetia bacterium]MDD7534566.1 cation:dicarboxylase symporter family transporter [Treponema sp.]MDY3722727.1 cation:dicarboxylase symporter family transporter [Treponema sp.]MDY5757935.1 cation:dicarboxylase symporter family transporter [Treponema sp.]
MKVWIKYLIGVALGVLAAFILPAENAAFANAVSFLTELFIRIGRYVVVPLLFTSAIVAVSKLRTSKLLLKTTWLTVLIIVASSLILTLIGLISILLVKLPRIPITVDVATEAFNLNVKGLILSLFPYSGFGAVMEGSFLLVCLIFAFIIGWESASEETTFKPVFVISDSFSNLFYNIAAFFTEIMSILCIAIVCYWTMDFRNVIEPGIYTPMIIMFIVDFIVVAGIIYPIILHFVCHDPHPYKVLFASIAPLILSFFGGDSNLVIPLANRHLRDSLGIRRRCRGFTYPLFAIFARGGSALVTTISFILIWRSYSSLSIPMSDILWIFGLSFGLSFLLGGIPSGGAFVLLTILCSKYARGFETSFLLLKPASVIICSFAALFDTLTAMVGTYIVAVKTKNIEHHSITHFI